jgi:hypothetical protein
MNSEEQAVYLMQDTDEEWVRPTPASVAIREAVTTETDLQESELATLEEYVDPEKLRRFLETDEECLTIDVEGHDVTIHSDGDIDVSD